MAVWGRGIRDAAITGLVELQRRQQWRESEAGATITEIVSAGLHDENSVVRMAAAQAAQLIIGDCTPSERTTTLGDLLVAETNATVRTVLLRALAAEAGTAPTEVDAAMERLVLSFGDNRPSAQSELGRKYIDLLTYLAIIRQTTSATQTVEAWMQAAPKYADEVQVVAQCARPYLSSEVESTQLRTFRLLTKAVDAAVERWRRNPEEHRENADLPDTQRSELEGAILIADTIANQIYFASGAFDHHKKDAPAAGAGHAGFANLAFPLLAKCATLKIPRTVHHIVETATYLAPLDEKRGLLAITEAIVGNHSYTREPLAGDAVIPYLIRLLSSQRQLVLSDREGTTAFTHLLAGFAAAGNEAALGLAFTFADVFR